MSGIEPVESPRSAPRNNPVDQNVAGSRPAPVSGPSGNDTQRQARPTTAGPAPRVVVKSSPLLPFALVLALTGLGLGGFVYSELTKAQQTAASAEARIQELESRLELSDDESSQSVAALSAKLKWADSEIRKLWGVSHDRNRKAIEANKTSLASVKKGLKSTSSQASSANKLAQSHKSTLSSLSKTVAEHKASLASVVASSEGQTSQMRELVDQANRLESQVNKLRSELAKRVASNEEAVASFDTYRRTTNRELLQIQQRLNAAPSTP